MEPNTITIIFNNENHTPRPIPCTISVKDGTEITFMITLPSDWEMAPTITFGDTDHDADVVTIKDPYNVINHHKSTNTYSQRFVPKINQPRTPFSQEKFSRTYLVKLSKIVRADYPLRDKVENLCPIGEPPTSSGNIDVSGGRGTELPSQS